MSDRPSARDTPFDATLARDPLFRLEFRAIWAWILRQPASFWLVSFYLFTEYVRPQTIFSAVSGWPIPFWTIVLCGMVFLLEGARFRRWHLGDGLMAAEALVVVLSTITAYDPAYARANYSIFFGWLVVYVLITNIVSTRQRFYVFLLLYLLYCIKMTQHGVRSWAAAGFHFIHIGVGCAPGWFQNSGECGAQMTILFPISLFLLLALWVYWPKWKRWVYAAALPFGSLVTIMASSSRGAIIGLASIGLWFVAKSRHRFKALLSAAVVAGLSWFFLPAAFKARFQTMGHDPDSVMRLTYWHDGLKIMHQFPLLGIGYFNWTPYYTRFYNPAGQVPHNIFIEAGSQTGYFGLIVFVACVLGTFVINSRTRTLARELPGGRIFYRNMAHGLDAALVGFLVTGSFVTILYYPLFWINLAMTVALNVAVLDDAERWRAAPAGATRPSARQVAARPATAEPGRSYDTQRSG